MNGEAPLGVNLEITVPRIVLSVTKQQDSEAEQVRLSLAGLGQPQIIVSAGTPRIGHAIKFCLFRLKLLEMGKPLLLQLLRRRNEGSSPGKQRVAHEGVFGADTLS